MSYKEFDWDMHPVARIEADWLLSSIRVRKTPVITNNIISNLDTFEATQVSRKLYENSTGQLWYRVTNNSNEGYVANSVVTIIPDVESDNPPVIEPIEDRWIIDIQPDTLIVTDAELPIIQAFFRNLLDRVNNPIRYEE